MQRSLSGKLTRLAHQSPVQPPEQLFAKFVRHVSIGAAVMAAISAARAQQPAPSILSAVTEQSQHANVASANPSAASTPAQQAGASGSDLSDQLQQVVVTATKRSENMQNIPITMSAITSASLEYQNIQDFNDYAVTLPQVSFTNDSPGSEQIFMRGIGATGARSTTRRGPGPKDLAGLIAFNEQHASAEMPYFGQDEFIMHRGPPTQHLSGGARADPAARRPARYRCGAQQRSSRRTHRPPGWARALDRLPRCQLFCGRRCRVNGAVTGGRVPAHDGADGTAAPPARRYHLSRYSLEGIEAHRPCVCVRANLTPASASRGRCRRVTAPGHEISSRGSAGAM